MFQMTKNHLPEFAQWLTGELKLRGWKPADLARQAKISSSQVSFMLNEQRVPSAQTCNAIADALGYPPEYIHRRAGHLPPERPAVAEEKEAVNYLRQLNTQMRQLAITILRALTGHQRPPAYTIDETTPEYQSDPDSYTAKEAKQ